MANSIEITSTGQVVVSSVTEQAIEITAPGRPGTVEVSTAGPQGPAAQAPALGDLTDVNTTAKVANSVLYYDPSTGKWLGNDINTVTTLTDGGNF